jgi:hypothetical protein
MDGRLIFEKLTAAQSVKKLAAVCGFQTFISIFRRGQNWTLFWATYVHAGNPSVQCPYCPAGQSETCSTSLKVKFYLQSSLRFTGAATLHVSWSPPWYRNCTFFRDMIVSPKPNPRPVGQETTLRLALDLSCRGGSTSSLRSRQHSSPGHGGAQTSSPW